VGLALASLPVERLGVSRSPRILRNPITAGRGCILFCGKQGSVKTETLSSLAGNQLGSRKRGKWRRIDALEELHQDGIPLVGVDVSDAFLQRVDLNGANLLRANFRSADIRDGSFIGSRLEYADLTSANLRHADLQRANLQNANLEDADLFGPDLGQADLTGAHLAKADLRNTDLHGIKWQEIAEIKLANVFGVKNAPTGFLEWAARMGAVSVESDGGWLARFNLD
jgi:Pentapeptide repeats (8 copies)